MAISKNAKKAVMLGTLCSVSYLAVYIARNILGAVTPKMLEAGFSEAYIGSVSSIYLIMYACGQMINGLIGDKIKAKWMIGMGLCGAGITNFVFAQVAFSPNLALVIYGITGFFLSMIYGPMTKVVSENVEPLYATRCSLGYTFASFFGSPAAGLLATFLAWEGVFHVGSSFLVLMALAVVLCFGLFEKRGIVKYGQYQKQEKGLKNIKVLFKHQIVKYSLISVLTGVVRTSVVFWLPTYISQYLHFSVDKATVLFSVAAFVISFTTFVSIFVYEKLGYDMDKTVLVMFSSSVVFFVLTYLIGQPVANMVFIVLAIMASNGAATMLWSRYCPSLRDTGMVSSVTGFLDCLSYAAAALANVLFANAANVIGWKYLILVWTGIVFVGVIIALPYNKMKKKVLAD